MQNKGKYIVAGVLAALLMPLFIISGISVILLGNNDGPAATSCVTTPGELPKTVPQPLNSIITQAAKQWDTDPIALAVLYSNENGWSFDREPAPPYGVGPPWKTSKSAGAQGPMQFLPGTWRGYQNSNPAHQPGDVMDLTDAVYAAAHYLSDLGGKTGTPLGDPATPLLKPSIVHALASYHSGPAFKKLGRYGRQYASNGYDMYRSLSGEGAPSGGVASPCGQNQPHGISGDKKYANTNNLTCAAGLNLGTRITAKGNTIRVCNVRGFVVNASISGNVDKLLQKSVADGLSLGGSGFRTAESQVSLREAHCATNGVATYYDIFKKPSSQCRPPTATPGESNHEQGLALDLSNNGRMINSHFDQGFVWLHGNAGPDLCNLPSEPWHWSVDCK